MDRFACFVFGVLAGSLATLGVMKVLEDNEFSLEELEESIEEKLERLEREKLGAVSA